LPAHYRDTDDRKGETVDAHLKKIEGLLSPDAGQGVGYITADDLKKAFEIVMLAVAEGTLLGEKEVVSALQTKVGPNQEPVSAVVSRLGHLLARWDATADTNPEASLHKDGDHVKGEKYTGLLGEVHGKAVPTTVADTVHLLNSLIAALAENGLVRDARQGVQPSQAVLPTNASGLSQGANSVVWTFIPQGCTIPADLTELKGAANVGDAALQTAAQAAFATADEYIVLGDGSRASWDGAAWVVWVPPVANLVSPAPGSNEWTFSPAGSVANMVDFATLEGDTLFGNPALQGKYNTPDAIDFGHGEFVTLADGSKAYFGVDAALAIGATPAAGNYIWQQGVAP
jgi:hypothetical protein